MTEEQKRLSAEEWWADKLKPSRRRRLQMTPYQRQCLAIASEGCDPNQVRAAGVTP